MQQGDFVLAFHESLPRVTVGRIVQIEAQVAVIRPFDAPGKPTQESISFPLTAVSPLENFVRQQPQDVFLAKDTVVLQRVSGIFQLAELVHDVQQGDALPLLRLYVGPRNGELTGIVTPTPLDAIRTPAEFLQVD